MSGGRAAWASWAPLLAHAVAVQSVGFSIRPAASYQALELGLSPALLGTMSAAYAFAPLALALPAGRAVDRWGERVTLMSGGLLLVMACGLMAFGPQGIGWLIGSLALAGVAHLMCVVGEQTAVAHRAHGPSDAAFGRYTFASSFGQAIGPMLIAVVGGAATNPDLGPVLVTAVGLAVVVLALSPWISGASRIGLPPPVRGAALRLIRDRRVRRAVIVSGIVMAAVDITMIYLPALGDAEGLSASLVGVVLAVRAIASMAVRLLVGALVRLLGRGATLVIGMTSASVGLLLAAFFPTTVVLLACACLLGAGLGVCQPLTMSLVADLAPEGQRGTALTLRILGNRLGLVVVPGVVGTVAAGAGAPAVLATTALLLGVGAWMSRRA